MKDDLEVCFQEGGDLDPGKRLVVLYKGNLAIPTMFTCVGSECTAEVHGEIHFFTLGEDAWLGGRDAELIQSLKSHLYDGVFTKYAELRESLNTSIKVIGASRHLVFSN